MKLETTMKSAGLLLLVRLLVIPGLAATTFAAESNATAVTVNHLRCEYREDPLGIDTTKPRLSWVLNSGLQTAYQIVVDGLWDSGKVMSDQSVNVEYAGQMLAEMGAWMKINGEGIYGSTVWKKWGEGPGKVFSGKLSAQTAAIKYSTADFRFTQGRDGSMFAWCLAVPAPGEELRIRSLGQSARLSDLPIKSVSLLGSTEKMEWRREADALIVRCPTDMPFHHAVGFRVEF